MKTILKYSCLLFFLKLFMSCGFEKPKYHNQDGKWTWKFYHGGSLEYKYAEIDSINHKEFKTLSEDYGKDNTHVFYRSSLIPKANPATFQIIKNGYSKDENHVFLEEQILLFANPKTFEELKAPYAKDDSRVFCGTVPLPLEKKEVAEFKVTSSSNSRHFTALSFFIERNPEYKWLDSLEINGVITGPDGAGKTKNKKFKGVKELEK